MQRERERNFSCVIFHWPRASYNNNNVPQVNRLLYYRLLAAWHRTVLCVTGSDYTAAAAHPEREREEKDESMKPRVFLTRRFAGSSK